MTILWLLQILQVCLTLFASEQAEVLLSLFCN